MRRVRLAMLFNWSVPCETIPQRHARVHQTEQTGLTLAPSRIRLWTWLNINVQFSTRKSRIHRRSTRSLSVDSCQHSTSIHLSSSRSWPMVNFYERERSVFICLFSHMIIIVWLFALVGQPLIDRRFAFFFFFFLPAIDHVASIVGYI